MATIFMMNEEIALGMVCFFHQKKHSYLIKVNYLTREPDRREIKLSFRLSHPDGVA
jgi:hypothetical protein